MRSIVHFDTMRVSFPDIWSIRCVVFTVKPHV